VLRLVMKEGAELVTAGTIIGLAAAWAGARALAAMESTAAKSLHAVSSGAMPMLLVAAPLLLAGLALLAAMYRRAVRCAWIRWWRCARSRRVTLTRLWIDQARSPTRRATPMV